MPTADLENIKIMLEMSFPIQKNCFLKREYNGCRLHNMKLSLVECMLLKLHSVTKVVLGSDISIHFSGV
jgi:hypothetical protein